MNPFWAELLGTMLLVVLGDGVVANVVLSRTKGFSSGWIVICFGWAMAVFLAVVCMAQFSGAHVNPAVTLGLALAGKFPWSQVPPYFAAQMLGASLGAVLVWLHYHQHFAATSDPELKLAVFCTMPAIQHAPTNFISESLGGFVLVFSILLMSRSGGSLGLLNALLVGLVVLSIGLSLGGTTGFAINPARDLAPRLMHGLLPISGKRDSGWSYAWIPVVAPLVGGSMAALVFLALMRVDA